METHILFRRWALTHALDTTRYAIFRLAYVARGTLMRWCLAFANFLERGQAHAISRAASASGLGLPAGVAIPPPFLPSPNRAHLSSRRETSEVPFAPPHAGHAAGSRSATPSGGSKERSMSTLDLSAAAILRVPESKLRYDDFDDAPTGVYHAVPTLDGRPRGAHRRLPAIGREIAQGEVRVTSK